MKLIEKITEKKERAGKIKEQQKRIADVLGRTVRIDPFSGGNMTAKSGNKAVNLSNLF